MEPPSIPGLANGRTRPGRRRLQPLFGSAGCQTQQSPVMVPNVIHSWLKRRRRRHLERQDAEMADLIERAYFCRGMSRFIDSVLNYREHIGYITEKQQRHLKRAVTSLERGM